MSVAATPRIVMCRPDYFEVSYAINPWMKPDAWSADPDKFAVKSKREWEKLCRIFIDLGIAIDLRSPAPGVPDLVFTANSAIVLDRRALLARFHDPERQPEEKLNAVYFEGLRVRGVLDEVESLPPGMYQEGAGDCSWDAGRQLFWAGHGQRSRRQACDAIAEYFGAKVVPLELVDPRFYHVDTCLSPLASGHIVYFPAAFSKAGRERLEREAGGPEWLIPTSEQDAGGLAVNLVNIGHHVVMASCSPALESRLNELDYTVHRAPLSSFGMSGGAAFCLTLRLDHNTSGAMRRAAA